MTRCLMLDVDGVLVNGRPQDGRSWAHDIERDLGIAPAALQAQFFAPHWRAIVTGRKALLDTLETCLPAIAPNLAPSDFLAYWFANDSALDTALLAECDAMRAEGLRILLATNQEHMRAAHLMETLALADHVDGIVYSAAIGACKPDPAFFAAAERAAGTGGANLTLVDDTAANVEAARAAGWSAVHWRTGDSLAARLAA
ncbi:HAD-IA family hydrolase [Acuticoccus kandeliae]|uniref:HAD-IA family hydrolase n=1 Tax=Acuticoccus kandeliae TaxID=2073160 RepID=UPI000D3E1064|nr:HAD-IA family hydrolase [Acuticoccus kandeliae]